MQLTEKEKEEIKALIDRGEPLPAKYRHVLFSEPHEAELIWPGKTHEATNVVLPFQSIEQIDEPRSETAATQADLFQMDRVTGRQSGGWTNKLIWGDNKLVLSSLKNGPLRRDIENAGGLKLVYIDPPFDVGSDFSFDLEIGESERLHKEPSVIEELAYRDTWGRGADSYLAMVYERLSIIVNLMAADASIYVHIGPNIGPLVRVVLDELLGTKTHPLKSFGSALPRMATASVGASSTTTFFGRLSRINSFGIRSSSLTQKIMSTKNIPMLRRMGAVTCWTT
jgi:adenine-specific DNA-methyltransferase